MSEMAMRRLTISRPLEVRTLRLRLRLFTFVSLKFPEVLKFTSTSCGVVELGNLPRSFSGHSILIISAPRAPNQRVAHGPARTQLKSTTRIPSSARGRDMASCSCIIGYPGLLWQTAWGRRPHSRPGAIPLKGRQTLVLLIPCHSICACPASRQLLQQRLGLLEISSVKALSEPTVHLR